LQKLKVAVLDKLKWNDVNVCLQIRKLARKSVLVKTKAFNRQTVVSNNQLFKVLSTDEHMPSVLARPPLINGLVDDALFELSSTFLVFAR